MKKYRKIIFYLDDEVEKKMQEYMKRFIPELNRQDAVGEAVRTYITMEEEVPQGPVAALKLLRIWRNFLYLENWLRCQTDKLELRLTGNFGGYLVLITPGGENRIAEFKDFHDLFRVTEILKRSNYDEIVYHELNLVKKENITYEPPLPRY